MSRRKLTEEETAILKLIQDYYGSHNTEEEVMITDEGEAVIFVKGQDRSMRLTANLTNLATWRADGTIATEEELLRDWLRVQDT